MNDTLPESAAPPPQAITPAKPVSVQLGIGSAIFQGALVVLGVILGFLITEWQGDAARRSDAQLALASILDEIAANRETVTEAHDYHAGKIKLLDTAARENTPLELKSFDRGFVAPAQVSGAAWATAGETGALADLPFDHVLALSRVYAQQGAYQQQQATVSSVIYSEMFARGTGSILDHAAGLRGIIASFHYRERQLGEAYQKALAEIAVTAGKP